MEVKTKMEPTGGYAAQFLFYIIYKKMCCVCLKMLSYVDLKFAYLSLYLSTNDFTCIPKHTISW